MRSELIKEEWRPVPEYIGLYSVSNFGRVRSLKYGKVRILKPGKQGGGYMCVSLCKNGKKKMFRVHCLVYETFNGSIPEGMDVNHINEIKTDNSLWNLSLMSRKENINYGTANKRRSEKKKGLNTRKSDPVLQLTLDDKLVKEWPSTYKTGKNGFSQAAVWACCNGKLHQHKGFKWRKKESVL